MLRHVSMICPGSCRVLLGCQGEEWWSCYARRHFVRARLRWSLRNKVTVADGIPTGLLAVVPVIVDVVPK